MSLKKIRHSYVVEELLVKLNVFVTHQIKMSKTNSELHEIELYLKHIVRKVNFEQFPISNDLEVLFCKLTT